MKRIEKKVFLLASFASWRFKYLKLNRQDAKKAKRRISNPLTSSPLTS